MSIYMVEKKDAGPKKRKRRKAKAKPRVGQIISQKVVVNVGKGQTTKRRTGTQAKRSVQPQQVIYQNQPIPLQPNYSSQINDLRDEVRASRIASIVQPEQRTNPLAPRARVPEKVSVKKERKILVDEDMPFDVPLEERRPVPSLSLRKQLDEIREDQDMTLDELRARRRTTAIAEGRLKKRDRATKAQMDERRLMSAEDPPKKRGPKPGSKNKPKDITLEPKSTPEPLSSADDKDTPSTSPGILDIKPMTEQSLLQEVLKRQSSKEIKDERIRPGPKLGSRNREKTQDEMQDDFLKHEMAQKLFRRKDVFNSATGLDMLASSMGRSASADSSFG